jgi:hypothetical protein
MSMYEFIMVLLGLLSSKNKLKELYDRIVHYFRKKK